MGDRFGQFSPAGTRIIWCPDLDRRRAQALADHADQVRLDWRGDRLEPLPNPVCHPSVVADDPRDLGAHEVELLASTLVEDVGDSVVASSLA